MAKRLELYQCDACGNIGKVADGGDGTWVCCGDPMKVMPKKNVVE